MSELTVKFLTAILAEVPEEAVVVLSQDARGNGFSPACDCTAQAIYVPARRRWDRREVLTTGDPEYNRCSSRSAVPLWPIH